MSLQATLTLPVSDARIAASAGCSAAGFVRPRDEERGRFDDFGVMLEACGPSRSFAL
jgi:hypothetical protein